MSARRSWFTGRFGPAMLGLLLMQGAPAGNGPGPGAPAAGRDPFFAMRQRMVEEQIERRGVRDPGVLAAMRTVPRERFVPEAERGRAYDDGPLAIGSGQTISQPYIVAFMTEAAGIHAGDRVLEVGTGSGYQRIQVRTGDGWAGWPEAAPYDAILVTAAPAEVPEALVQQLKVGGRMV